jgi:hypothetical protein
VTRADLIYKEVLYEAACYEFTGSGQVVDLERRTWALITVMDAGVSDHV